jgi:hypothetical protein
MIVSLRLFARSRCLRVMGVLAWLMLVTSSLAAAPLGMEGHTVHSRHAVVAALGEPSYHGAHSAIARLSCCDDSAGCCAGQAGNSCNCATACNNALPSAFAAVLGSSALGVAYGAPSRITAPSPYTAPPLRPPAV